MRSNRRQIFLLAAPLIVIAGALVALLLVRGAPGAEASCSSPPNVPTVVTDRSYYYLGQKAQIDGCGFQVYATQSLLLRITRSDSTVQTYKVTVDANGNFIFSYLVDCCHLFGHVGSDTVAVLDASGTTQLAGTTFL